MAPVTHHHRAELHYGSADVQREGGVHPLPFPHVVTTFLKSDHEDRESENYSSARYLALGSTEKYLDAGPTYRCNYFPRVYRSGALGLHVKPRVNPPDEVLRFSLVSLSSSLKKSGTKVDRLDSAGVLRFAGSTFEASATIKFNIDAASDRHWSVGWIQGCLEYHAYCDYENGGRITYELPKYGQRTASHRSSEPWHNSVSYCDLEKLSPEQLESAQTVSMIGDPESTTNVFPLSFFFGIEYCKDKSDTANVALTAAYWKQKYRAWLVLKEKTSGSFYILRSVTWWTEVKCSVSTKELLLDRGSAEVDNPTYFMPEATFNEKSTLRNEMAAVYTLPQWGDVKFSHLLAHRKSS